MRALVIYESIFGNTRDVAQAIARGLSQAPGVDANAVEVGAAPATVAPDTFLVVGGPIHAWGMTREMTREGAREEARRGGKTPVSQGPGVREWLQHLPTEAVARRAATFDTSAKTSWFPTGSAAKPEARLLEARGFTIVATPQHFYVKDKEGPLFEGELERAQAWGFELARLASERPANLTPS